MPFVTLSLPKGYLCFLGLYTPFRSMPQPHFFPAHPSVSIPTKPNATTASKRLIIRLLLFLCSIRLLL